MTTTTLTAHWIGKCGVKGCRCVVHIDVPMIEERWTETHHNHAHGYSYPVYKRAQHTAPPFPARFHPFHLELFCAVHKRQLRWVPINGKLSEEHVCDSRCMNATGPNCECSCGGKNHGRGAHVELVFA